MGNHMEVVDLLLERKANVNCTDKDGCSALTIACREGFYDIAIALLDTGAYINIQVLPVERECSYIVFIFQLLISLIRGFLFRIAG